MFKYFRKRKGLEYLGKFGKHKAYVIKEVGDNSYERYFMYVEALHNLSNRFTKIHLDSALDLIDKANNEKDFTKIAQITQVVRSYSNLSINNDFVLDIVKAFILIDDEPEDSYSTEYLQIKEDLYKNNTTARFFFIRKLAQYLPISSNFKNITSLEDFLMDRTTKIIENSLSQLVNTKQK